MKYAMFLVILLLIACTGSVTAANRYDTKEGFTLEIPSGWTAERDSVNNGIVTFVMVNDDPYSTWIKISSAPSGRSGLGSSDQEVIASIKSGLQSSGPTYIDTPQSDAQRNIFVTRVKTSRDFYVTMMVYRNNGVDTSGLLSSKNQQTVAAHEQDLVAIVKSTTLTDVPDTPGFDGVLALAGLGAAALVFVRRPV